MRRIFLIAAFFLCGLKASSQSPGAPADELRPVQTIRAIRATMATVEADLELKRAELQRATTAEEKAKASGEIDGLNLRLEMLRYEVESVATGIDIITLQEKLDETVDIGGEFRELARPLVNELKKATAKPREIEKLRSNVSYYTKRRAMASRALDHIDEVLAAANDPETKGILEDARKTWQLRADELDSELEVATFQLEKRLKSDDTFFRTIGKGLTEFVGSRGKNFLLAVLSALAVLFAFRFVHRLFMHTRLLMSRGSMSFGVRLFHVIYYAGTIICSVFAGMIVLYMMGDWLLLGFTLIFIAGIAWAGKTSLPKVFEQAKLMLNLGSVREGERIIFNGVPWDVRKINVYSDLANPWLQGGTLRVPLRDLIQLNSRVPDHSEPYFPSKLDDWLLLPDSTLAKVVKQTPEWVQLVSLGNARHTYPAADFVSLAPENLSAGFRLSSTFGIDYQHQAICTSEVPKVLAERLQPALEEIAGDERLESLGVEFAEAGASSLDYTINADFRGEAAPNYFRLKRAVQRICVDACNERGWVIPFMQVTVHDGGGGEAVSDALAAIAQ